MSGRALQQPKSANERFFSALTGRILELQGDRAFRFPLERPSDDDLEKEGDNVE